jgi:N-acetylneuraminic acid mutarotase
MRSGIVPAATGSTKLQRAFAASGQIGQDLYIMGGMTPGGQTATVEHFSLATGNSDLYTMMPFPASYAGAAAVNNKIYVVGGLDASKNTVLNKLQILDVFTKVWTSGKPIPTPLYQAAVVAGPDGNIYVFGGTDASGQALNTTWCYSPKWNAWTRRTPIPVATSLATAVQIEGTPNVMVLGGSSNIGSGTALKNVQLYNTACNKWVTYPSLAEARYGACSVVDSGKVYCLFGAASNTQGIADGEVLTGRLWQKALFGSQGLLSPIIAKWGNEIFIIGGKDLGTGSVTSNVMTFKTGL